MMKAYLLCPFIILLAGCSSTGGGYTQSASESNVSESINSKNYSPLPQTHGSLYSDGYMLTLFSDKRAYRIGDILTVVLDERTLSSKSADANIDKSSNWDVSVPLAGNLNVSDLGVEVDSTTDFSGESSASQQNYLSGAITVRVTEVLSNGALAISGRKQIRLNQGDEIIELKGIVRAEDIDVANRISSRRIADAQISYEGKGTLSDATKAGWLTQLFTRYLNPF